MTGMLFPKEPKKKKKKKHRKSILQSEKDKRCFLCMLLKEDYSIKTTEEHHVFDGPNRIHSEEYGLTVRLCVECHRTGNTAVHNDIKNMRILQRFAQEAFEAQYDHEKFMSIFGRNYIDV